MRGERFKNYYKVLTKPKKKLKLLTQPRKDTAGFTLIELLVSIAIMIILTFVGVSQYRDFNEREKLRQAIRDVKTTLQEAQKRAQAGEMDETACFNRTFEGWVFRAYDNNSYEIKGYCLGGCAGPICDQKFFNRKTFPDLAEGITFQTFYHSIIFKPFGAGVQQPATITLIGEGGRTESVSVDAGGEITLLETP